MPELNAGQEIAAREDEGTVVECLDEFGKPMFEDDQPVTITVVGVRSKRYRRAEEAIRRRPIKHGKLTGEKFYDENLEKVIACTVAWKGWKSGGQPAELNRDNAAVVYTNFPWIYDQVMEAMNDASRFFRNSSEN